MRIDSHQHFWKYNSVKDAWITDDMKVIQRDFMPHDLLPLLEENNLNGCVAVQTDQSEEETEFLLQLAEENDFIKGVVGWVDLRADNVEERLKHYSKYKKIKGFRHIVQGEADENFLLQEDFCSGIAQLEKYNFTYDILIFPKHLPVAIEFVKQFPNQKFVIDHLAKPDFKQNDFSIWEKGIREIASCPNVYCKVSGMTTEANWKNWKVEDFTYCLDVVAREFGMNRLMYGSDWPVSLLASNYQESIGISQQYFAAFSEAEQEKFWGANAIHFYNL
jgi:L-fuconolactonase